MISVQIEATNPFCEGEDNFDSVEIVDSNRNADASASEYIQLFVRAMLGLSFTEKTIVNALANYVSEFKVENSDLEVKE